MKLSKRIEQINSMRIPLVIRSGNQIPRDSDSGVVDLLESDAGNIPEVKLSKNIIVVDGEASLNIKKSASFYKGGPYFPELVKAGIKLGLVNEHKIPEFFNIDNTATHGIFDPVADVTYFFLLPE